MHILVLHKLKLIRYNINTINLVHIHPSIEKVILCPCVEISLPFVHTLRKQQSMCFQTTIFIAWSLLGGIRRGGRGGGGRTGGRSGGGVLFHMVETNIMTF